MITNKNKTAKKEKGKLAPGVPLCGTKTKNSVLRPKSEASR